MRRSLESNVLYERLFPTWKPVKFGSQNGYLIRIHQTEDRDLGTLTLDLLEDTVVDRNEAYNQGTKVKL